jgi:hypothetical protein
MLQSIYTYYFLSSKWHLDKCKLGDFFGAEAFENVLQCENTLDFNALNCKMDFDRIQNSCDLDV